MNLPIAIQNIKQAIHQIKTFNKWKIQISDLIQSGIINPEKIKGFLVPIQSQKNSTLQKYNPS